MEEYYSNRISQNKKGNEKVYEETCKELFGRVWSDEELKNASNNDLIKLMCTLKDNVQLSRSPIDVKRMANAIQGSRSGISGCAVTDFECAFCGEIETWANTAVPKICTSCATKMAKKLAQRPEQILKDNASFS